MKLNTLVKVITYFQLNNSGGRGQLADAVRSEKICFQMRLEMRWRVNEAEIYKTFFHLKFLEFCY